MHAACLDTGTGRDPRHRHPGNSQHPSRPGGRQTQATEMNRHTGDAYESHRGLRSSERARNIGETPESGPWRPIRPGAAPAIESVITNMQPDGLGLQSLSGRVPPARMSLHRPALQSKTRNWKMGEYGRCTIGARQLVLGGWQGTQPFKVASELKTGHGGPRSCGQVLTAWAQQGLMTRQRGESVWPDVPLCAGDMDPGSDMCQDMDSLSLPRAHRKHR